MGDGEEAGAVTSGITTEIKPGNGRAGPYISGI